MPVLWSAVMLGFGNRANSRFFVLYSDPAPENSELCAQGPDSRISPSK